MKAFTVLIVTFIAVSSSFGQSKAEYCSDKKVYNYMNADDLDVGPGVSLFSPTAEQQKLLMASSPGEISVKNLKRDLNKNANLVSCDDNSEGQGTGNAITVEVKGLNCVVKYVYGYEYGNDKDPKGFYSVWTSYSHGFNCKIVGSVSDDQINIEASRFNTTRRLTCRLENKDAAVKAGVLEPLNKLCNSK